MKWKMPVSFAVLSTMIIAFMTAIIATIRLFTQLSWVNAAIVLGWWWGFICSVALWRVLGLLSVARLNGVEEDDGREVRRPWPWHRVLLATEGTSKAFLVTYNDGTMDLYVQTGKNYEDLRALAIAKLFHRGLAVEPESMSHLDVFGMCSEVFKVEAKKE